jgi:hypothetical protein
MVKKSSRATFPLRDAHLFKFWMFLTYREVVEDLRSSLQLSDAQNLALQVILSNIFLECNAVVDDIDETSNIITIYGMPLNRL